MNRVDELDARLSIWFDEVASGGMPDALLESVLASTGARRSRPRWLVALRGRGMGTTIRVAGQPVRRLAYVAFLAALIGVLVVGLLLAGASRLPVGPNGLILFFRTDDARSTNTPFRVAPDGSGESELHDGGLVPGIWSPDAKRVAVKHLVPDQSPLPGAESAWIRPALVNVDGSDFTVLDAYPNRRMQLDPVAWSSDGARIFVSSGSEDVDPADMGIYTVRASDGGDLKRVLVTPPGTNDFVSLSPDGTKVLVSRSTTPSDGILFVAGVDGGGHQTLTPPSVNVVDLPFYDGISEAWSPDGSRVAFAAWVDASGSTALFVVNADGTDPRQIVSATVGAVSVQWSPDGSLLAFTSEDGPNDQVAEIRPDGNGLRGLTDGADGSTSVAPVWSPDGTKLLFQRKLNGQVSLWTMNADGSSKTRLTRTPVATDWVGGYEWAPELRPSVPDSARP
jgi:dipeptidyl aminopeptidase/acylaminoacyl peptidase